MSLCEVHWQSQVLRKKLGMYVILPDVGRPPYPTFYLLHGLSDDYTTWLRRTRIEWYVRPTPLSWLRSGSGCHCGSSVPRASVLP